MYYKSVIDSGSSQPDVYRVWDDHTVAGPLSPRFDLWNHSPTAFQWGYGGSGPAQLALAILADHLKDDNRALLLHQAFKFKIIACLPQGKDWTLTASEIDGVINSIERRP